MSTVTKLFVVLHVVLSMLLTAGVVVFVNRVDEYNKIVADWKAKTQTAEARATANGAAADAAKEALNAANTALAAQVEQSRKDATAAAAAQADLNVKLADASKQLAILTAANDNAIATVKASQTAQSQYMAQVTELRTTVDTLTKAKFELDTAVADLTNQRDVLEKQRRDLAEKVSMLDSDLTRATKALADNHIDLRNIKVGPGLAAGAPPIQGVVREVRMIEQVPYATISVGSADAVIKGMEFKVIDREKGEYLGKLTVESVDTNEATGRLQGPKVDQVHQGLDVRTQL